MQMYNLALGADNDSLTRLFRSCVLEHGCYGARMNKFSQGLFAFNSDHISLELMDLIEKADSWSAVANYLAKAGFDKGVPGPSLKDWILTTAVNNYYQPKGFKIRPDRNYYEEVFAQAFDDQELLTDQEYQDHLRLGHLKRRADLFKSGK